MTSCRSENYWVSPTRLSHPRPHSLIAYRNHMASSFEVVPIRPGQSRFSKVNALPSNESIFHTCAWEEDEDDSKRQHRPPQLGESGWLIMLSGRPECGNHHLCVVVVVVFSSFIISLPATIHLLHNQRGRERTTGVWNDYLLY